MMTDDRAPWWVNATLKLGVTTMLLIGLVWFLTQDVKTRLDEIRVSNAAVLAAVNQQSASIQQQQGTSAEIRLTMDSIRRILMASCANAARDIAARNACFQ